MADTWRCKELTFVWEKKCVIFNIEDCFTEIYLMHRIFLGWEEKLAISGKGNNYQTQNFSIFFHYSYILPSMARMWAGNLETTLEDQFYGRATQLNQAMETESFYDYEKPNYMLIRERGK